MHIILPTNYVVQPALMAGPRCVLLLLGDVGEEDLAVRHPGPLLHWTSPDCWARLASLLPEPVYLTFQRSVSRRRQDQQWSQGQGQDLILAQDLCQGELWTYYKEDSLDTNTTDISEGGENKAGQLDHTYYSIDTQHLYHTLDPALAT